MAHKPADMMLKQYETTVTEFILKERGHFVVATHDNLFISILRSTITKQLAVSEECVTTILDINQLTKTIKEITGRKNRVVLFIERSLDNKETSFLIKQIKEAFSNTKIIILTGEADRQRLVLLHEIGADNFISKPISINTLIEKIAFTIKPQGKIGKLIDAGKLLNSKGAYENALKVARQILDIKPNSAAGLLIMGDAYRGMGKKEKAVQAYESASENASMYMEPLKKLADFWEAEGDQEMQLHFLEKLDKLSPLNVERKVDMGNIHVDMGNEEQAEQLFDTAMTQAKKEALSYIEEVSTKIANIYAKKHPEKAEKYYRRALETKGGALTKSDIKTFNMLGIALRKQGRWQDAIKEYQKALKVSPDDEHLFFNMAMAFAEGNDFRRAYEHLNKALEINPQFHRKDAVLSYNIGLILAKAGARSKARHFLENCLEVDPEFERCRKLLQSLS